MPATTNHPSFKQPLDPNVKLWRYMDFTKFMSILSNKSLYFGRIDSFEDKHEGTYTSQTLKNGFYSLIPEDQREDFIKVLRRSRKSTY
ncbi:hypothetical protein OHV59_11020, partial [Acinetobacter baumannii]|nr:hypothetical protein [Acinetobacter baumannii]